MGIERYHVTVNYPALRKPINRCCYNADAVDRMVAAYKRRQPSATISVSRKRLVLEMVDGSIITDKAYGDLPVNVPMQWKAQVAKATLCSSERFEATVEMIDERITAAKNDKSIIAVAVWLVTDYCDES